MLARLLLIACLTLVPGCNWLAGQGDTEAEEDLGSNSGATGSPVAKAPEIPQQRLALNLQEGDRFPLLKTVTHTLRQPTLNGWITSQSNLEMLLSVIVQEIYRGDPSSAEPDPREGQKRLLVRYHRIKFSQELPGQSPIDYDSENPPFPVPLPAQGYHGLKDNGFEFWLSADNQILEMIGFDQFIDRCLKDVIPSKRLQVRAILASNSGADGIANFVDDSIGLLPAKAVREGDTWTRERQVLQPVPMHASTRYTLRRATPEIAEIEILGAISPSATYGPSNQRNRDVTVTVRGGQAVGNCLLDRRTGLPIQSRVEQSLNMAVRMADGSEFDQQKSTMTTIKYFPEQSGPQGDAITVETPTPRRKPASTARSQRRAERAGSRVQ